MKHLNKAMLAEAAPDMLAALKALVICPAFNRDVFEKDKESHKAWTLGRMAIEKATGDDPTSFDLDADLSSVEITPADLAALEIELKDLQRLSADIDDAISGKVQADMLTVLKSIAGLLHDSEDEQILPVEIAQEVRALIDRCEAVGKA
nr:hypothetical protein [Dechloromonas sp.]